MLSINICALTTDRQMHSGIAQTTRLHLSMTHTSNLLFCAVRVTRWGGGCSIVRQIIMVKRV